MRARTSVNHLATRLVTVASEASASFFQALPQTNGSVLAGRHVMPGEGLKLVCDGKWWVGMAATITRTADMPVDSTPALNRSEAVVEAASHRLWAWRSREKAMCFTAATPSISQVVAVERATRTLTELACFVNETHAASRGLGCVRKRACGVCVCVCVCVCARARVVYGVSGCRWLCTPCEGRRGAYRRTAT